MTSLPPAGWYPDPSGSPGMLRYWDGEVWGDGLRHVGSYLPEDISLPVPQKQSGTPWAIYRSDLKWSAQTLRSSPYLVIVSLGLVGVFDLCTREIIRPKAISGVLILAIEVFLIGFVGAQRVWFLRKIRGLQFEPYEVWTVPWRFFGRFLCLDLLGAVLLIPVAVPIAVVNAATNARHNTSTPQKVHLSFWITACIVIGAFLVDIALTFVVPALALNVRSVKLHSPRMEYHEVHVAI